MTLISRRTVAATAVGANVALLAISLADEGYAEYDIIEVVVNVIAVLSVLLLLAFVEHSLWVYLLAVVGVINLVNNVWAYGTKYRGEPFTVALRLGTVVLAFVVIRDVFNASDNGPAPIMRLRQALSDRWRNRGAQDGQVEEWIQNLPPAPTHDRFTTEMQGRAAAQGQQMWGAADELNHLEERLADLRQQAVAAPAPGMNPQRAPVRQRSAGLMP
jgi:hypothetical protein